MRRWYCFAVWRCAEALYDYFDTVLVNQLKDELSLAVTGTEESSLAFLEKFESDRFRVTWIASDGVVLYATHTDGKT